MADTQDRDKRISSFLDFFPIAKKAEKKEENAETVVQEKEKIISVMQAALMSGGPIKVQITGETIQFFTFFALEDSGSADYLLKANILLIAPLDPPLGNLKIRRAPAVVLSFFTDTFIAETRVRFLKVRADRNLELTFPQEITRSKQKRVAARYKVDSSFKYQMRVVRPSGVPFEGKIIDISTGGMAFYARDKTVARMEESGIIKFEITPPGLEREIHVEGKILGAVEKEGQPCFRAQFKIKTQETLRLLKKFVDAVANDQATRRQKLFEN